jgi:hypothetical protein
VIDHGSNCKLIRELRAINNSKFARALSLANDLRDTYFPKASTDASNSRGAKTPMLTRPVLNAISAIAIKKRLAGNSAILPRNHRQI